MEAPEELCRSVVIVEPRTLAENLTCLSSECWKYVELAEITVQCWSTPYTL